MEVKEKRVDNGSARSKIVLFRNYNLGQEAVQPDVLA